MRTVAIVVLGILCSPPLQAQVRPTSWFAGLGAGPVIQDRQGNDALNLFGIAYQGHVGRRLGSHVAVMADITHVDVPLNDDAQVTPCPEDGCAFTGPVQLTILTVALAAERELASGIVFASLGAGLHRLHEVEIHDGDVSAGVKVAIGGRAPLAGRLWAFAEISYHRLFTTNSSPQWFGVSSIGVAID